MRPVHQCAVLFHMRVRLLCALCRFVCALLRVACWGDCVVRGDRTGIPLRGRYLLGRRSTQRPYAVYYPNRFNGARADGIMA